MHSGVPIFVKLSILLYHQGTYAYVPSAWTDDDRRRIDIIVTEQSADV